MMLDRSPLLQLYDEGQVLTQVLNNTCAEEATREGTSDNFGYPSQRLFPTSNLITLELLHTLFPHEISLPSVNEASMKEMTKQIEAAPGKKLIINYNLFLQQEQTLKDLLQQKKFAFS